MCGSAEGAGQVLLWPLIDWGHVLCPCPALTQSVLPVLPANSSGKGWALMLLNWVTQLEAPRLCRLSRDTVMELRLSYLRGYSSGSDHTEIPESLRGGEPSELILANFILTFLLWSCRHGKRMEQECE